MDIRLFEPEDLAEVVEMIAKAFFPTDLYAYMMKSLNFRFKFLMDVFRWRVAVGTAYKETELAVENGRVIGAAVWTPPATFVAGHLAAQETQKKLGPMSEAIEDYPREVQDRWLGFFDLFLRARDQVISQPYWALTPIAVAPDRQGRKVASALMRKKLAEFDAAKLPCFLGTQDEFSRDIYLHYGFAVFRRDLILDSGLLSYSMVRSAAD
ncbi:MAG: GNAT family N-acetyltransferase [Deltaproteobacteria bacterium]|jgi:GNAT superfamily N-acetyltransferase|nr:GNAT family N-acetyltransferase [Deltaproteobacteria bacterium]